MRSAILLTVLQLIITRLTEDANLMQIEPNAKQDGGAAAPACMRYALTSLVGPQLESPWALAGLLRAEKQNCPLESARLCSNAKCRSLHLADMVRCQT
jgi:hypothetical protein